MAAARRMHQVVYRGGASLAYAGADGRDGAQLAVKSAATGVPPRAWAQPNVGLLVGPKAPQRPSQQNSPLHAASNAQRVLAVKKQQPMSLHYHW